MPFITNIVARRIQWGECDPAEIVYYPRYFEMFDESTTAMFSAATGLSKYQMFKHFKFAGYPMVDTRSRFIIPCRFGDDVTIETTMTGGEALQLQHHASAQEGRCSGGGVFRDARGWAAIRPTRRRSSLSRSRPR